MAASTVLYGMPRRICLYKAEWVSQYCTGHVTTDLAHSLISCWAAAAVAAAAAASCTSLQFSAQHCMLRAERTSCGVFIRGERHQSRWVESGLPLRKRWLPSCIDLCYRTWSRPVLKIRPKKRSERRKHCALAVRKAEQKFSPRRRPVPGGAGRPKFNQLETVTTFTYKPSLVRIDARNLELSW